jgi:hypothetical protein
MKITHLSVYKILQDGVFNNVNSYEDMNNSIKKYGERHGLSGSFQRYFKGLDFNISK